MNTSKTGLKILYYSKYLGLVLIIIGIPTIILDHSSGSEMPLLVGLFTLLVTTDRAEDERSVQIKTTSLYLAFIISYGTKLVTTNLHHHALISYELTEINHFLILTLALANMIFYGRLYVLKY
ncbi:MAG: hypothetical protein C0490_06165 [Marivirga sp.]|nr:hypothetical protein [Marivirga sp.]